MGFHMSQGQNSSMNYIGLIKGPYYRATRLYIRSFDHGSYGLCCGLGSCFTCPRGPEMPEPCRDLSLTPGEGLLC